MRKPPGALVRDLSTASPSVHAHDRWAEASGQPPQRPSTTGSQRTERMSFRVSGGRRRGVIQIAGGAAPADEEEEGMFEDEEGSPSRAVSMRF